GALKCRSRPRAWQPPRVDSVPRAWCRRSPPQSDCRRACEASLRPSGCGQNFRCTGTTPWASRSLSALRGGALFGRRAARGRAAGRSRSAAALHHVAGGRLLRELVLEHYEHLPLVAVGIGDPALVLDRVTTVGLHFIANFKTGVEPALACFEHLFGRGDL